MPAGIGGLVAGASSIAGGIIGSNAAGAAANAANNAAVQGNAILSGVQTTTSNNLQPFVNTGQGANSALAGLLGIGGNPAASEAAFDNYLGSTNYNFLLNQGEQAVDTANAPNFDSGATAKALNNYAQGQAGSALAGYEGMLSGLDTSGIGAASSLGYLSNQNAAAQSGNLLAAAGVQGSADIYGANAMTGALRGLTSASSFGGASPVNAVSSALSGLGGGSGFSTGNYGNVTPGLNEGFNAATNAYTIFDPFG